MTDHQHEDSSSTRTELDLLYQFFADHLDEIRQMPASFASRHEGLRLAIDVDDLISIVMGRFADRIDAATTAEQRNELSVKFRSLGYINHSMRNESVSQWRRDRRFRPLDDDVDQRADHTLDEFDIDHDAVSDVDRLQLIIKVLRARAQDGSPRTTCLTDLHLAAWTAATEGHGALQDLARLHNVSPSRISQIKLQARSRIYEVVYVAGVLGPPEALDDPQAINAALDVYDGTEGGIRALTVSQRAKLTAASACVTIRRDSGQRADGARTAALYLTRKDKRSQREQLAADGTDDAMAAFVESFIEELHESESAQAAAAGVDHPNCVTACTPHNPHPDRIIWEVKLP